MLALLTAVTTVVPPNIQSYLEHDLTQREDTHPKRRLQMPDLTGPYAAYIGNVTEMGTPITKNTTLGPITGRVNAGGIERYFGIPVAPASLGADRFKYPGDFVATSSWTEPVETVAEKVCLMFNGLVGTEDCVAVDIQTKTGIDDAPVACWVHGGGFTSQDSGSAKTKTAAYYAKGGPTTAVVQVMMHYRLGYLGWAVLQGAEDEMIGTGYSAGNYGMSDIIFELEWVSANIHTFGGSNQKINLYGESAGGAHVAALLASPLTEGLVKGFILESPYISMGDAMYSYTARKQMNEIMFMDLQLMGVFNASTTAAEELAYYRSPYTPAFYIDGALDSSVGKNLWDPAYSTGGPDGFAVSAWDTVNGAGMQYFPVVDGHFLTLPPHKAYANGINRFANIIIGHNVDEQATFYNSGFQANWTIPEIYTTGGNYFPTAMAASEIGPLAAPWAANVDGFGLGGYVPAYPDSTAANPANLGTYMGNNFIVTATNTLPVTATVTEIWTTAAAFATNSTFITNFDSLYAAESNDYIRAVKPGSDSWLTACVTKAIYGLMDGRSSSGGSVYRYLYAESGPDEFSNNQPGWGACHGCELAFVLGMYENDDPTTNSYPMSSYNNPLVIGLGMSLPPSGLSFSATYSPAEIALGTTMKKYWVNFFSSGNPNGAGDASLQTWVPVADASTMNVMVFKSDFTSTGGTALNPCLQTSPCVSEPALNYRKAHGDFMNTGDYVKPATCDSPVGGFTHEVIGSSCLVCPPCPSGRRSALFGAPMITRPAGCPICA